MHASLWDFSVYRKFPNQKKTKQNKKNKKQKKQQQKISLFKKARETGLSQIPLCWYMDRLTVKKPKLYGVQLFCFHRGGI